MPQDGPTRSCPTPYQTPRCRSRSHSLLWPRPIPQSAPSLIPMCAPCGSRSYHFRDGPSRALDATVRRTRTPATFKTFAPAPLVAAKTPPSQIRPQQTPSTGAALRSSRFGPVASEWSPLRVCRPTLQRNPSASCTLSALLCDSPPASVSQNPAQLVRHGLPSVLSTKQNLD